MFKNNSEYIIMWKKIMEDAAKKRASLVGVAVAYAFGVASGMQAMRPTAISAGAGSEAAFNAIDVLVICGWSFAAIVAIVGTFVGIYMRDKSR